MKMYDALGESKLPDLHSGRFIANDHGPQWTEWKDPRVDLWYTIDKISVTVDVRKSKTENTLLHQVVSSLY